MKEKEKYKPNDIDKIEKEMRKRQQRYADYQLFELEIRREWWIRGKKGAKNGT